jgi:hypothetical protein
MLLFPGARRLAELRRSDPGAARRATTTCDGIFKVKCLFDERPESFHKSRPMGGFLLPCRHFKVSVHRVEMIAKKRDQERVWGGLRHVAFLDREEATRFPLL